jgi:hypothetical protein
MCDYCVEGAPYKNYHIVYDPKPIPDRRFDYDYYHDDYDLGDPRHGNARSVAECIAQIDEIEEEAIRYDDR